MFSYQNAGNVPDSERLVPYALPWVMEAGNPYYDSLFGEPSMTATILESWMRRRSSEISISRVQFLLIGSEHAGGFIGLGGDELRKARKADTVALLTAFPAAQRVSLMKRADNLSGLFPSIGDHEYYLSKLGLNVQFRGRKLARLLVDRYIEQGAGLGFTDFRLDVQIGNEAAIRCYRSAGFQICHQSESRDGTVGYYSMRYGLSSV
jgi:ribosomal protein S18 acetylase RimI-like enzyme